MHQWPAPMATGRVRSLKRRSFIGASILAVGVGLPIFAVNIGLQLPEQTYQAQSEEVPVVNTFVDNDKEWLLVAVDGVNIPLEAPQGDAPETLTIYRAELGEGRADTGSVIHDGVAYAEKPFEVRVAKPLAPWLIIEGLLTVLVALALETLGMLYGYSTYGYYPSATGWRPQDFTRMRVNVSERVFFLWRMGPALWVAFMGTNIMNTMIQQSNETNQLKAVFLGVLAGAAFALTFGLLESIKNYSAMLHHWAAQMAWGKSANMPAQVLEHSTGSDRPYKWFNRQNYDRDTFDALKDNFEGTLGELVQAARTLGPE